MRRVKVDTKKQLDGKECKRMEGGREGGREGEGGRTHTSVCTRYESWYKTAMMGQGENKTERWGSGVCIGRGVWVVCIGRGVWGGVHRERCVGW